MAYETNYYSGVLSCLIIFIFLLAGLLVPGGFWLFWFWFLLIPTWGWSRYRYGYVYYKYVPVTTTSPISIEEKSLLTENIKF